MFIFQRLTPQDFTLTGKDLANKLFIANVLILLKLVDGNVGKRLAFSAHFNRKDCGGSNIMLKHLSLGKHETRSELHVSAALSCESEK